MYFYWKICYFGHFLYTAPGQPGGGGPRLYQRGRPPPGPPLATALTLRYRSQTFINAEGRLSGKPAVLARDSTSPRQWPREGALLLRAIPCGSCSGQPSMSMTRRDSHSDRSCTSRRLSIYRSAKYSGSYRIVDYLRAAGLAFQS